MKLHFTTSIGHLVTVESKVVPHKDELIVIKGKFYKITAIVWNVPNNDLSETVRIDILECAYQPFP